MLYIITNSNPSKEQKIKKITCRAYRTFKTQLTADFGQFWVLESKVPGLLETWNFVWSMTGAQLDYPENFRSKKFSQAEI